MILRLHQTREDLPNYGVVIDATAPLERVVDEILLRSRTYEALRAVGSVSRARVYDAKFALPVRKVDLDHRADADLAPPPGLGSAVDPDRAAGDQRLRPAIFPDEIEELRNLPTDDVLADLDVHRTSVDHCPPASPARPADPAQQLPWPGEQRTGRAM